MGAGVAGAAALAWLVALSVYDIRQRRLPNWLTLPGAAVVLLVAVAAGRGVPAMVGGIALFALYVVIHLLAPSGMGAGDVKLAMGVGALTGSFGVDVWALAAVAAPLLTAVWAVVAVIRHAESTVPHGPSMCTAAAVATALAFV
jgi:leader peptidase (prepilin peptidase) / N-methyltransferase